MERTVQLKSTWCLRSPPRGAHRVQRSATKLERHERHGRERARPSKRATAAGRYAKESYRMAAGGGTAYWSMMHFPLASRSNVQPSRPFSVQKYAAPHGRRPRSCRQVRERALPEPGRSVRRQASRKPSRSASRRWVRANERVGAEALRDPAAPRDYPDLAAAAWPRRVGLRARCMGARQSRSPGGSPTCPRRRPTSS